MLVLYQLNRDAPEFYGHDFVKRGVGRLRVTKRRPSNLGYHQHGKTTFLRNRSRSNLVISREASSWILIPRAPNAVFTGSPQSQHQIRLPFRRRKWLPDIIANQSQTIFRQPNPSAAANLRTVEVPYPFVKSTKLNNDPS